MSSPYVLNAIHLSCSHCSPCVVTLYPHCYPFVLIPCPHCSPCVVTLCPQCYPFALIPCLHCSPCVVTLCPQCYPFVLIPCPHCSPVPSPYVLNAIHLPWSHVLIALLCRHPMSSMLSICLDPMSSLLSLSRHLMSSILSICLYPMSSFLSLCGHPMSSMLSICLLKSHVLIALLCPISSRPTRHPFSARMSSLLASLQPPPCTPYLPYPQVLNPYCAHLFSWLKNPVLCHNRFLTHETAMPFLSV